MSTDEDEPFDIFSMVVDVQENLASNISGTSSSTSQPARRQDSALERLSSIGDNAGLGCDQVCSMETRRALEVKEDPIAILPHSNRSSCSNRSIASNSRNVFISLGEVFGLSPSFGHENGRNNNVSNTKTHELSRYTVPIVVPRESITQQHIFRNPSMPVSPDVKMECRVTSTTKPPILIQVPFTNENSDSETDDTDFPKVTTFHPPRYLNPYIADIHSHQRHNSGRATMDEFQQCFRESTCLSPRPNQKYEKSPIPSASSLSQFETPEIRVMDGIDPNTRISRRRATNAMGLMKIDDDAISETSSQDKRRASPPPVIERNYKRRKIDSKWTVDTLLSNPESPVATAKLDTLISQQCWDMLSHSEKRDCLALLPSFDKRDFGYDIKPMLFNNKAFQEHCTNLQTDLKTGKMSTDYEQKAKEAKKYRKTIETNDSKVPNSTIISIKQSAEKRVRPLAIIPNETIAMPIKRIKVLYNGKPTSRQINPVKKKSVPPSRALAGEQVQIRMSQMFEHGYLQIGDIWTYNRGFASEAGKFRSSFSVTKNVRLIAVDDRGLLTFECPTGPSSELTHGNIKTLKDVRSPTMLEGLMLEEDGRIGREVRTNGNAFKLFRIMRGGRDIGSLFDVRKRAWEFLQRES
ncbi:hypothetical protein NEOLI_003145 [Neolecta irregularis DAH-3]|uniref:ASX DEUBAD domain-containing protein n=1 Tax=Neolecta irregularis (strain DAH-3) TaxID=1198029 RepID=A0A1U7LQT5_NEOID|nr:hypothetical protein NEOLI_003145 [Neolecta irregularis DAH-3]|eukprot:OLL24943.1 hypothetical protein NEOLI_003145 [Neolecta irregularis DAH-3]